MGSSHRSPLRAIFMAAACVLAIVATAAVVQGQPCPLLRTKIQTMTVGWTVYVKVAVTNLDATLVDHVAVRLGLPSRTDVAPVKTAASPSSSKGMRVQTRRAGDAVFFLNVAFRPRQTRKFWFKGKLVNCAATTLNFTAMTYLADPAAGGAGGGGAASCPSPERTTPVYAKASPRRHNQGCPSATPSPTAVGGGGGGGIGDAAIPSCCPPSPPSAPVPSRRGSQRALLLDAQDAM